jgi:hypothetical protein
MPYTNIVWIKLFLSLFEEDDRFLYQLNESQQLLFIKMLYMAAITDNKIPKNPRFICSKVNYHHEEECFNKDLERISDVFNGLKFDGKFYSFKNFHKLHNYVRSAKGVPKECPSIVPDKDKEKIKIKSRENKEKNGVLPFTDEQLKNMKKDTDNLIKTITKKRKVV